MHTTVSISPIIRLGHRCFGEANMAKWLTTLIKHWLAGVPFTKFEGDLRKADEDNVRSAESFAEEHLEHLISETLRAAQGIRKKRRIKLDKRVAVALRYGNPELILRPPSRAVVTHEGNEYEHDVDGICCIACIVLSGSVATKKIAPKFVSHPFWQLGVSSMGTTFGKTDDDGDDE